MHACTLHRTHQQVVGVAVSDFPPILHILHTLTWLLAPPWRNGCPPDFRSGFPVLYLQQSAAECVQLSNNSGLEISVYVRMYIQWNPSNPDTLGPEMTVLIIEMSSFQGLKMYYGKA